jgi:two-component system sensor histidine kinase AtoS
MSDIGRLASTIAHEIRNPLSAIKLAAYNIKRKANTPLIEKHLETVNKKVLESDQIIQNLLNFTRIKTVDYEGIKIGELLRDCCVTIAGKYAGWDVSLVKDIRCADDAVIEGGFVQLRMLFSNVLDNAYQSLQEKKGTVTVSLSESRPGEYRLAITDTGVGMDADTQEKIFEPFFTTRSKGTGLGLTVCREIVDLHKGKIEIQSASGKGTSFAIALPMKQPLATNQPTN